MMSSQADPRPLSSERSSPALEQEGEADTSKWLIGFHEDGKNLARAKTDSNLQAQQMVSEANDLFGQTVASMKMLQHLRASLSSFPLPSRPPATKIPRNRLALSSPTTSDDRQLSLRTKACIFSSKESPKRETRLTRSRPATSLSFASLATRPEELEGRTRPASAMEQEERRLPDKLLNVVGYLPPREDQDMPPEQVPARKQVRASTGNASAAAASINFPSFPRGSVLKHMAMTSSWVEASRLKITPGSIVRHKPLEDRSRSPPALINSLHTTSLAAKRLDFNKYLRVASG